MDPNQVEAILKCHVSINLVELQTFLGLLRYYRKFIKDYARIDIPLYYGLVEGEGKVLVGGTPAKEFRKNQG